MKTSHRILNLTKNIRLKPAQALRAIENCACAWVVEGESIRDLTLAEAIAARHTQANEREPLPLSEIHGLKYEPSAKSVESSRRGFELTKAANLLCVGA